ncbi:LPS assembly protein LptD [Shewanella psychropiezotolerans]|uniref:LPS-assembly protein LptD n=1 Tax=Shewanella psychropiezotolerans TaxID=2593655 RepID=A0ABX5X2N1_9GAMM|nr:MULTISPECIES: LPS assembly protein LptD [Shewanella]MPY23530.1 LPS assembly protein LptD [Shewanella sp. YLB-07]QDO85600.1 LPS assembly protein LptD [Shewanella psychropiezotolerans]
MHIRYFLALSLLPQLVLAEETTSEPDASIQCLVEPPVPRMANLDPDASELALQEIRILSDRSEAQMGKQAKFNGNVSFSQGGRHIAADEAILDQESERLDANGNLVFQDQMFTITADSLVAQMRDNSATLTGAQYWLHGQQIHGDAEKLEITPDNNLHLTKTNFTTCPPGDSSWLLEAERIKIDSTEEWGELWDAKLKIGGIPILYIPYMTIPVSDKRKSGFLFPQFSTSTTNGVEVATPYYWNIAPEYDLTFTPHYMSARGLFLKTDFRYLAGESQQGQINVEYLGNDNMMSNNADRYLYHWQHKGAINENWRVLANFTQVSDNNYFNDMNSDVQSATDNQLSRIGEISYFEKNWDFSARVQDIKVLGEDEIPYQVMPQLNFNYRAPSLWNGLDFDLMSEITNFKHQENEFSTATRLHIEPSISLPIQGPAGSLTSEVKLLQTYYWQDDQGNPKNEELDDQVSRTLPQVRIHGQVNFERFTDYFNENYRQTLEPQFQYLYVGYEDQSNIGIYDTAQLQEDYYGLFRERRFSGLDRIADANQMTLGLTTRLFDEHNVEKFKFSLGQIFYFQDSRVGINEPGMSTQTFTQENTSNSVLAAELSTQIYKDWYMSGAIQYDTKQSENKKSEVTLDFRPGANKLLQLSYRYVPDLLNTNTNESVDISQAGMRGAWPVSDNLYLVGNWYYDLNESRNVETYAGFQYESCCWAIRLSYHYRIKTNYEDDFNPIVDDRELFEKGIYLNFVIKGLGGSGPLGVTDMLDDGLFNYRKPLYLKN